ncbi:nuclear transcription factor Y subunit B-7-like [Dorcoceras hygrometricum]|uniref:Nuclear transcription factor Y subunit B-7-like n=1 Tax=Dorcoceras hygrometricum TaxID=472368 RepID=A0A2Z7ABS0_9LAMI|nr:nuclear transcription factor Y subunit B-7-like [Dorcoceras hygrometricum]
MKRARDNEYESPPNRPFRINQETTSSNTQNITTFPTNINISNVENANKSPKDTSIGNNNDNNNINKEQDRFLPIANVGRIMKKVIPGNGKISKDAKETVQECVSEFISFVTGEASEKCQREKRKTINGDDILWAIMTLGFEDYVNPLKLYLTKYREIEGEKLNVPKQQRLEQHDQKPNVAYNNVYGSTNMMPQPFVSNDPSFPLSFSQNSIPTTLPQQDNIDGPW